MSCESFFGGVWVKSGVLLAVLPSAGYCSLVAKAAWLAFPLRGQFVIPFLQLRPPSASVEGGPDTILLWLAIVETMFGMQL